MTKMQGRAAIAKVLKASGVECVFGMDVGFPIFLTPSLIESRIKMFMVRNEMHGALMATGYSRISGKPGICSAASIGSSHLAVGLREAQASATPVVSLTDDSTQLTTWKSTPHFIDQIQLFKPIAKWMVRPEIHEWIPALIRRALEVSVSGAPGVVSLILPDPIFGVEIDFEAPLEWEEIRCPRLPIMPDEKSINRATEILLHAKRPNIIAGGGVISSQASKELVEIAELLNTPVATSHIAQSVFPNNHPLSMGVVANATPNGRGKVAYDILSKADAVLFVGTRMDRPTTNDWKLPPASSKIIHIDIDPMQIGHNCPVDLGIIADAKLALRALKDSIQKEIKKTSSGYDNPGAEELRCKLKKWREENIPLMNSDDVPIKTPRLMKEIQPFLNKDTIVAVDVGSSLHWVANYLEVGPETPIVYPQGFVAIGSGFPMAMGAQVAAPNKRVIHIAGDGGFGYNIMELETCMRYNLPVINIIINNGCYGATKGINSGFDEKAFSEVYNFAPQNFCRIAESFGAFGARVEKPQEIKPAIDAALSSGKPSVVEVITGSDENIEPYMPMHGSRFL